MTQPSADTLLDLIYRYYPVDMMGDDPDYVRTDEFRRLACVLHSCAATVGVSLSPVPATDDVVLERDVADVVQALSAWPSFMKALAVEFPNTFVWDQSAPWDEPLFRCDVPAPGYRQGAGGDFEPVVCVVSALAPVYALFTYEGRCADVSDSTYELDRDPVLEDLRPRLRYTGFAECYREREARLVARVEAMFGFVRLPDDTLRVAVPDVAPRGSNLLLGEATVMDCLFTSHY